MSPKPVSIIWVHMASQPYVVLTQFNWRPYANVGFALSFPKPLEEVNRFLTTHSVWVQQHYESGRFLVSGRREPPTGGVIVARAESEQELREILAMDPLQQMGLVEYEIVAFEATAFPKRSGAFDAFASQPFHANRLLSDPPTPKV